MSSFFQRARDRAQGAAAQLSSSSQSHSSTDAPYSASSSVDGADGGGGGSTSSSSGFTYKGGLPHVFRAGLASVDPRFEATRSLHVLRGSLKAVVIDDLALSRETKTAAAKVYKWGSDHKADGSRLDGAGDDVLVDLSDRLAFLLSTMGDLEAEHSERLSRARSHLKEVQAAELELAGKRAQRVKLIKELQNLVAERVVVASGPTKADQLHAQLDQLQQDARVEEEALSKLKRQKLQACFDAQFDSYIAHGEKMALVASYGKLLMQQVPIDEVAPFPAQHHGPGQGKWAGSAKTAQIRAAVEPALKAYVPHTPIPTLSYNLSDPQSNPAGLEEATTQSDAASFLSFETTHARELAQDEEAFPSAAEEKQRAAHRSAYTPMSALPEHGKAADPPALPPRHTGGSTASGPPLPPRHTEGATTDVVPPLLATGGSLHHPSSDVGSVGSQPPPVPARSDAGSISTHRVPPPLNASSTTALNYWDPSFLETRGAGRAETTGAPYAVVLLNQLIADHQKELFKTIWAGASVRICADGGANQLLSTFGSELNSTLPMPNAIVGDFDSLTPSSRSYFESANVHLAHRPSQYATDLGKSIQWLEDWERAHEQLELVIFGGLSGRMDQTAHTLHVLWKLCPALDSVGGYEDPGVDATSYEGQRGGNLMKRSKTWIVGDESLVYLVPPGVHKLRHPRPVLGVCCGVLPLGVEATGHDVGAKVKTQGLEWDLDPSQPQSMGGYLSTSNHVLGTDSSEVTIETDKPIYWSSEFGPSSPSTAALQQARGGEKSSAALGGASAYGPYSPADPFADQSNIHGSPSLGRRISRSTPGAGSSYLSGREGENNEPVENLGEDSAPPGPTVAETGQVIPSSPSGPGPLSGTLQPRRRSSAYRAGSSVSPGMSPNQSHAGSAGAGPALPGGVAGGAGGGAGALSPSLPPRPPTQRVPSDYSTGAGAGTGAGEGQGPVGYTTPAYLPPPHASPLSSSSAARPAPLRVPSADFVSGSGAGQGQSQGYGASTAASGGVSTGAAPPLNGSGAAGASSSATDMGPVPGGFPSSSYSSSANPTSSSRTNEGGAGRAGGAGGIGLALAAGISHHNPTEQSGGSGRGDVRARIRRDGTITRRGVDSDFDQAESEQLPPYTEM